MAVGGFFPPCFVWRVDGGYRALSLAFLWEVVCSPVSEMIRKFLPDRSCCCWCILRGSDGSAFLAVAMRRLCVGPFSSWLTADMEDMPEREECSELELTWVVLHIVLINYHCKNVPFLSCVLSMC